ncbi:uncharacterized protein CTRU02_201010 [Colletotrichum truncatum]|uniref:Uncharacterized protein n=1 Tax=Colletotrichum truncatum TaxID=5467 RepID=A0ACC3ZG44_COLTU
MVHPSHQPQYSVSVENDVGLGEWLDKLNSNPRLREESAFLKDGVVHLLLNLVEICESGVDLDLLKEDITTISSYNTKRAPRPNEDDSTAAASGLQRSRSRDASTELPAKRRRRLPDSIMKKDELASFVRSWGEVTHTVSSAGTSEGRLHGYWRQYDLWKRWHELKELGQVTSPKRL